MQDKPSRDPIATVGDDVTYEQLVTFCSLAADLLDVQQPTTERLAELTIAQLLAMDPDRTRT